MRVLDKIKKGSFIMEVFITQLVAYISQLPGYLWQLIQYFFATEHFFESLYYLSAFAGVILLYLQWPEANKTKRTELIEGILQQFRFDPEFSLTLNLIDYGQFHYNAEFHGSALRAKDPKESLEFKIDRLLSYMDYICYLHQGKTITDDEFYIVKYEILRACESISVQRYLWNLYHFSHDRAMGDTYHYLINFMLNNASQLGFDKEEFLNKNSKLYPKYLNF